MVVDFNKKRGYNSAMAQYSIAFDMDTKGMRASGMSDSEITQIYQQEIPQALAKCGFTEHPQGSLYHTRVDQDPVKALMNLQRTLTSKAPTFCRWVKRAHVFRMEEWSDVTSEISYTKHDAEDVDIENEIEENDLAQVGY